MKQFTGIVVGRGTAGNDFRLNMEGVRLPEGPVPVLIDYDRNRCVGNASIYSEDGVFKATIRLNDATPSGMLYPALQFKFDDKDTRKDGDIIVLESYSIISVGLCTNNVDPEIKPIGLNDMQGTDKDNAYEKD